MTLNLKEKLNHDQIAFLVQGLNVLMIEKESIIQLADFHGDEERVRELTTELSQIKILTKAVAENMEEETINYNK